jgi:hypothetical protein
VGFSSNSSQLGIIGKLNIPGGEIHLADHPSVGWTVTPKIRETGYTGGFGQPFEVSRNWDDACICIVPQRVPASSSILCRHESSTLSMRI